MIRYLLAWVHRTDWLWLIIGGFYLLAYLFWYQEALAELPGSLRNPPGDYPPHWPLDFAVTGLVGAVLTYLGFRRAADLATGRRERRTRWTYRSTEESMR
ncbi:hypothetical protein ACFQMA_22170 [Halosimplex aquaticum]|uniref:Uncharacterized protein n=1 Tax=Halosimplex aquaticum TaxID=3026162 RepID=A0ABD5Y5B2_9EURY|nr:hypothetical protein [Halosimplex aquaticum]